MQKPPFDLLLFGGTGDLAMRKILPSLFAAHKARNLHPDGRVIALAREELDRDGYLGRMMETATTHMKAAPDDPELGAFAQRLDYLRLDARAPDDFDALAALVGADADRVVVCYLATAPGLFVSICEQLARVGLNGPNVRVVLEKPLGRDLESSEKINADVACFFPENQLYRIDHYLGKESVQNLMAIRFGNVLFEPLWRREWVDNVQITIAEELGVEGRGEFYDRIGAMRDMVQNHLLQLLCIVAMEPPSAMEADAVRDEKLKVLKSLKPFTPEEVARRTVRGQYRAGAVEGKPVVGYLQEPHIPSDSRTETFVAIKAEIVNWRWTGVPFFLRTGKRMQERLAEIVITFRSLPLSLFNAPPAQQSANRLVIELQPDESVSLHFLAKEPGDGMRLQPSSLNLDFESTSKQRREDAYERLVLDVIRGRLGLFMRRDELAEAWRWVEPILDAWEQSADSPRTYTAGTWGPAASTALLSRDGAAWHEEL